MNREADLGEEIPQERGKLGVGSQSNGKNSLQLLKTSEKEFFFGTERKNSFSSLPGSSASIPGMVSLGPSRA